MAVHPESVWRKSVTTTGIKHLRLAKGVKFGSANKSLVHLRGECGTGVALWQRCQNLRSNIHVLISLSRFPRDEIWVIKIILELDNG